MSRVLVPLKPFRAKSCTAASTIRTSVTVLPAFFFIGFPLGRGCLSGQAVAGLSALKGVQFHSRQLPRPHSVGSSQRIVRLVNHSSYATGSRRRQQAARMRFSLWSQRLGRDAVRSYGAAAVYEVGQFLHPEWALPYVLDSQKPTSRELRAVATRYCAPCERRG